MSRVTTNLHNFSHFRPWRSLEHWYVAVTNPCQTLGSHEALPFETLTDLNDFITPSQACIKPVEQAKSSEEVAEPGEALVSAVTTVLYDANIDTDSNSC